MTPTAEAREGASKESSALEEARTKRIALGEAIDHVEQLIARPGGHPTWTTDVEASLRDLDGAFDDHVDEVEGADGILAHLMEDAPRLANHIKRMTTDHVEIDTAIAETVALVHDCGGACDMERVEAIRIATVDLIRMISRHRQAGADLVYEAYTVDIGGG